MRVENYSKMKKKKNIHNRTREIAPTNVKLLYFILRTRLNSFNVFQASKHVNHFPGIGSPALLWIKIMTQCSVLTWNGCTHIAENMSLSEFPSVVKMFRGILFALRLKQYNMSTVMYGLRTLITVFCFWLACITFPYVAYVYTVDILSWYLW